MSHIFIGDLRTREKDASFQVRRKKIQEFITAVPLPKHLHIMQSSADVNLFIYRNMSKFFVVLLQCFNKDTTINDAHITNTLSNHRGRGGLLYTQKAYLTKTVRCLCC